MTFEISPMVVEMLARRNGGESFARVMEWARQTGAASNLGVDWLDIGRVIRNELGWESYPFTPPRVEN